MKYLITYKLFEFVETSQNTPTLYKDDNLEVKVSKTFDSVKQQNKDTNWCSTNPGRFYGHNKTANMYRINFKDGYKLRLTWDYIPQEASELGSYSGGTHWGQGGVVDGEKLYYDVFRPRNNDDPFYIDWQSEEKREIVDRIKSIPDEAKLAMMEYQEKMTKEKSELITRAFKEIELIKVINVEPSDSDFYKYLITVTYRGKKYEVKLSGNFFSAKELGRDIKNKYALVGNALPKYLLDKTKEFLKKRK
jgi:hypothetical protein